LVVDRTEPQDPDPAPHLLVVIHSETISTHTVTSDEAIEHHLVESTVNDHSLQELEVEIKQAIFHLLVVAEDMPLGNGLQLVAEMIMLSP
jgi:hypothetical protein